MEIRPIRTDEIESTVRMWRRSREAAQPWLEARMGYTPANDRWFFREMLVRRCDVWVALDGERIVGLLAIAGDHVHQLYVEPADQRRGIGSALLGQAFSSSPARLMLHTHQRNAGAQRFYEHHGFREVARGVSAPPESEPDIEYQWEPHGR